MTASKSASLRELNQRSGQIIAEVVASGVDVVVTDRGRPVARIVREPEVPDEWARMIRDGEVVPAAQAWQAPRRQVPATGRSSKAILAELRGDR